MKAIELINRSLVLSGIVSRSLQQATGEQGKDGLFWLNQILSQKSATGRLIPYYAHKEITASPGQEIYFFEDLITADILTFNIGEIRYSVRGVSREEYFGSSRPDNISSLPYSWYWERVPGGINIYLYFKPAGDYPIKVTGLVAFPDVVFDDDLNDGMDKFYQHFLMYELANSLCNWYKMSLPPSTAEELSRLRKEVTDINPKDYSIMKDSMFGSYDYITYAQVAFPGWTT